MSVAITSHQPQSVPTCQSTSAPRHHNHLTYVWHEFGGNTLYHGSRTAVRAKVGLDIMAVKRTGERGAVVEADIESLKLSTERNCGARGRRRITKPDNGQVDLVVDISIAKT